MASTMAALTGMRKMFNKISGTVKLALVAAIFGLAACGTADDPTARPKEGAETLFWAVKLNHRAAALAIGQTLQLSTSAQNPLGQEIPGLAAGAVYMSTDTGRVHVTPTGLITARAVGSNVMVTSTVFSETLNMTIIDTVRVTVTATNPGVTDFSIQPADSTTFQATAAKPLPYTITSASGPVTNVPVRYYSSDDVGLLVNAWTGSATGRLVGQYKVWAEAYLYGTAYTDTVTLNITHALFARIVFNNITHNTNTPLFLRPYDITIRRGGVVRFQASSVLSPTSVTFDNPAAIPGGNIPEFKSTFVERTFPTAGTYTATFAGVSKPATIQVVE